MTLPRFCNVNINEIPIDRREIYILMGYGNHIPNQDILDIIEQMFDELKAICTPYCGYILAKGEINGKDAITLNSITLNPGRIITSAMREAEKFAIFTATAGKEFDQWLKNIESENDIVHTFIANTIGSVIAESTVSFLMKKLEEDMVKEGLKITNNYSPGYCDWILAEQKKLFSLFPAGVTRIELTDSCLMLPIKSVSGIAGIGVNAKKRPYGCEICKMVTCIKNKKRISS